RHGTAVAGDMLHDWEDAAFGETLDHRAAQFDDLCGVTTEGAVPYHAIGAFYRHVQHGSTIDIDAQLREFPGDQPCVEIGRFARHLLRRGEKLSKSPSCGARFPMRLLQARYPSAFLIDQDWGVSVAHR